MRVKISGKRNSVFAPKYLNFDNVIDDMHDYEKRTIKSRNLQIIIRVCM